MTARNCQLCGDCTDAKKIVNDAIQQATANMKRALKTGRCQNPACDKETTHRFCSDKCRMQFNRQQPGYKRPAQRWTAKKSTPEEEAARIEAIVQRAAKADADHQTDVVNDWSRRAHTVGIHAVRMG